MNLVWLWFEERRDVKMVQWHGLDPLRQPFTRGEQGIVNLQVEEGNRPNFQLLFRWRKTTTRSFLQTWKPGNSWTEPNSQALKPIQTEPVWVTSGWCQVLLPSYQEIMQAHRTYSCHFWVMWAHWRQCLMLSVSSTCPEQCNSYCMSLRVAGAGSVVWKTRLTRTGQTHSYYIYS